MRPFIASTFLAVILPASGCSCSSGPGSRAEPESADASVAGDAVPARGEGTVRAFHASVGLPRPCLDVLFDEGAAGSVRLEMLTAVAGPKLLSAGEHAVAVDLCTDGLPAETERIAEGTVIVEDGGAVVLFVAGLYGTERANERVRVLAVDDASPPEAAGHATARWLNLSVGFAGDLSMDLGADDPAHPEVRSVPRFVPIAPSALAADAPKRFSLVSARVPRAAFTVPPLPEHSAPWALVVGHYEHPWTGPESMVLVLLFADGTVRVVPQDPLAWVMNGVMTADRVQVYLGDDRLGSFPPGFLAERPILPPPGELTLGIYQEGEPPADPSVGWVTAELESGKRYLLVVAGSIEDPSFPLQLLAVPDRFTFAPEPSDRIEVQVVHAAALPGAIDVGPRDGAAMDPADAWLEGAAFGAVSPIRSMETLSSTPIGLSLEGDGHADHRYRASTAANARAFLVLGGVPEAPFPADVQMRWVWAHPHNVMHPAVDLTYWHYQRLAEED